MPLRALVGAQVFDGTRLHDGRAVLIDGDAQVVPEAEVPAGAAVERLTGGVLLAGCVDLQVNGGGGVMFNDAPSPDTLRRITEAHRERGTVALLPTLITDTPGQTRAAIEAVAGGSIPGIIGLHLEGPHLSVARKGAHDPALIRAMGAEDLEVLCAAAQRLQNLMITVAPETVPAPQIAQLVGAGAVVSLGHSDAGYATCRAAMEAGAQCTTHLFNAMSPLGNREPGLVGATLDTGGQHAGLIADGIHVHPATIRAALSAKVGPGAVFLVTDAMSTVGSDITAFTLNDRQILRRDGRLTLADGTLAGADVDMPRALRVMVEEVGVPLEQALRMATTGPAAVLGDARLGRLQDGTREVLHLSTDYEVTWFA